MRVNKSIEQGIYVVLMLALQKDHTPVKSHVMSKLMDVSDSYLKKILRKMVLEGIITSTASKDGGFQLAKPVTEITLYDVYHAIDGGELPIELTGLAHRIFVDDAKLDRDEQMAMGAFQKASNAFDEELKQFPLSNLLIKENYENGWTNWADHVK